MKSLAFASRFLMVVSILAAMAAAPSTASASHAWDNYHWARTSNPLRLSLGDNLTNGWNSYLVTTSADWSVSPVVDTTIVPGQSKNKNCRPTTGRVEVCNATYGNNGWLGVAQIWASGSHITQAAVRVNDTYFKTPKYNTPAWKNLVMCQEVGHALGLDHQDEDVTNAPLGTCMDYTNDPTANQHPNSHDYDQLLSIYAHLDSTTTAAPAPAGMANGEFHSQADWGQLLRSSPDGRAALFERDFGNGHKIFTFVFWAR